MWHRRRLPCASASVGADRPGARGRFGAPGAVHQIPPESCHLICDLSDLCANGRDLALECVALRSDRGELGIARHDERERVVQGRALLLEVARDLAMLLTLVFEIALETRARLVRGVA